MRNSLRTHQRQVRGVLTSPHDTRYPHALSGATKIESERGLETACLQLAEVNELSVDTEFVRERTYFARLCLIQIGADDAIWLIDPLAIDDLTPLWTALTGRTLIFHAARQDLEILSQASGQLPTAILDTQVMASLAGHPPQIGYAGIVAALLGIELDKSKTRTNWSRRPLDADELAYAAADVEHLAEVRTRLADTLVQLGRLDWAIADSSALLDPALYANATQTAWQRVKGIGRLADEQQSIAMTIATWREQTAIERNLPRQWVLRDTELLAIAAAYRFGKGPPTGFEDKATERRHAVAIGRFLDSQRDRLPPPPVLRERPDPEERERAKRLGALVAEVAADLKLEAEVLASMRELRAATAGERDLKIFRSWRRDVVGNLVLDALERG